MVAIIHNDGCSVSNKAEMKVLDTMSKDRKSVTRKKAIHIHDIFTIDGEYKRNDIVQGIMNNMPFEGYIDKCSDKFVMIILTKTDIDKKIICKFVNKYL